MTSPKHAKRRPYNSVGGHRWARVKQFHLAGLSDRQIARTMKTPIVLIRQDLFDMLELGQIKPKATGRKRREPTNVELIGKWAIIVGESIGKTRPRAAKRSLGL